MANIAIIGAGSWGLALATVLVDNHHQVLLWTKDETDYKMINETHKSRYTNDLVLDEKIKLTLSLAEIIAFSKTILIAIPVNSILGVIKELPLTSKVTFVIASKGLFQGKTVSSIIEANIDHNYLEAIVALSGPSFSKYVIERKPTAIVSASKSSKAAKRVQTIFNNHYFRVYTSNDIEGVEFCGAIKNVIALGAGILSGAGYGANAQAALISRGLHEMVRFAKSRKIKKDTLFGLTGVGDLVLTATDMTSRNYHLGYEVGKGASLEEALISVKTTAESINTLKEIYTLKNESQTDMPIVDAIYNIIYLGKSIEEELSIIMSRNTKNEWKL